MKSNRIGFVVKQLLFYGALLAGAGVLLLFLLPPRGFIPVLMYHFVAPRENLHHSPLNVSTDGFRRQMRFLKTLGFRPITAEQFRRLKTKEEAARGKEVLITFDDGNETFLQYALPVLEEFQIPAINFLVWESLRDRAHGSMGLAEAKRLAGHHLVAFGSHTIKHPILDTLDFEAADYEIRQSRVLLEKALGQEIRYFSYPEGIFNASLMELVKDAGYDLAFATSIRKADALGGSNFSITRLKIGRKDDLFMFWLKVSGISSYTEQIKRWVNGKKSELLTTASGARDFFRAKLIEPFQVATSAN